MKYRYYLVLDTNVLVSGLISRSLLSPITGNLKDFPRKPFVMSPTEFIDMFDAMYVNEQ